MLIAGTGRDAERVAQHIVGERSNGRRAASAVAQVAA
jgi:hypothetical protein